MNETWRKSTHSIGNGQCVEVGDWRKSTYSFANGNCAETASANGHILVRDTTDRDGCTLSVPAGAWKVFTASLKG